MFPVPQFARKSITWLAISAIPWLTVSFPEPSGQDACSNASSICTSRDTASSDQASGSCCCSTSNRDEARKHETPTCCSGESSITTPSCCDSDQVSRSTTRCKCGPSCACTHPTPQRPVGLPQEESQSRQGWSIDLVSRTSPSDRDGSTDHGQFQQDSRIALAKSASEYCAFFCRFTL